MMRKIPKNLEKVFNLNFTKKKKLVFLILKEKLYDEILHLKQDNNGLLKENSRLRTKITTLEVNNNKK